MKVTMKQKLEIAKKYLEEGITLRELSEEYDLNLKNIKYFVSLYELHGEKIFLERETMTEHTGEVSAYDLSRKPNFNQIKRMMNNLIQNHGDKIKESYLQSDQGWQYQMKWYQLELEKLGIKQSMSRRGNCLDNSPTENLFGRIKVEMFNNRTFESLEHLEDEIHKYLKYYNEERIVTKLKTSPLRYRARFYNQTNT